MTSDIRTLRTWEDRAAAFDAAAQAYREQGNARDAEFAEVNAKSMRLLADAGVEIEDDE